MKTRLLLIPMLTAALRSGTFAAEYNYEHHIIAVDKDGSALMPTIKKTMENGEWKYRASFKVMDGEKTGIPGVAGQYHFRKPYYDYLDRMFADIKEKHPKQILIYVHGGMNFIAGAAKKSAKMTDELMGQGIYPICICWNSNLFDTYGGHLFEVRDGVSHPMLAKATSPVALVADVGSAVVRAPFTWLKLLGNDLLTVNPNWQARYDRVEERKKELERKYHDNPTSSLMKWEGENTHERRLDAKAEAFTSWLVTVPTKMAIAPLIDDLGTPAWNNMLRRSRTMFDRESSFVASVKRDPKADLSKTDVQTQERLTWCGREGATRLFFLRAEEKLGLVEKKPFDRVTLVGHSMGAIVAGRVLEEFPKIFFDDVVFMAAASSVREFNSQVVPYLEDHPKTKFHNLCLNQDAERAEKNPGNLDLSPRGSLLVWIDMLLDTPASENDRTMGRFENAILATDTLPKEINRQITMKAFGRDRLAKDYPELSYTYPLEAAKGIKRVAEPMKHGDFSRFDSPANPKEPNFAFWESRYRDPEKSGAVPPPKNRPSKGANGKPQ